MRRLMIRAGALVVLAAGALTQTSASAEINAGCGHTCDAFNYGICIPESQDSCNQGAGAMCEDYFETFIGGYHPDCYRACAVGEPQCGSHHSCESGETYAFCTFVGGPD